MHEAVPQLVLVGACRHAPLPSQVPTKPHGGLGVQPPWGSTSPAGTARHVPARPVTAHDWQFPQLGAEQQTPSTQLLLSHSAASLQSCPSRFPPHDPPWHRLGEVQSASLPQAALHVAPLHAKDPHDCVTGGVHTPLPSQVRASVAMGGLDCTGQTGAAHCVPAAYSWQPPLPSQNPVVPQLPAPWSMHCPVGSCPSAAIGWQLPRLPTMAHDTHGPAHAVAQQTRWAQTVLAHSLPVWQLAPLGLRPQEPISHTAGGAQSAVLAQVDLQAPAPHANGKHELAAGVTHAPAPSHVDSGVSVVPVAGQLAARHRAPCG